MSEEGAGDLGTLGSWKQSGVSEIEDVTEGHRRETEERDRLLLGSCSTASDSPQEQVPGTELLCRLDNLALG